MIRLIVFLLISGIILTASSAAAAEKTWSAAGDGINWADDDNWSSSVAPTSVDDVLIDSEGASVSCAGTFKCKSLTIGGRNASSLTSNNFVFGQISPETGDDVSILNRSGGTLVLKGSGILTVEGQYKDSEEVSIAEPSFMFWVK